MMPFARRAGPRFLRAGQSTRLLATGHTILWGGVLTARSGNASLRIWTSATSTVNSTQNHLTLYAARGSSARLPDVPIDWATGMAVSCSGTGAEAVLYIVTQL
jgi:hypothetical protein